MLGSLFDQYLQSTIAAVLGVALLGVRAASRNSDLRRDLRGAAFYLFGAVGVRMVALFVDGVLWIPTFDPYLDALRLLLFSFGLVRMSVGGGNWLLRGRRGVHTPKIVRDCIDGVLYLLVTAVVLRTKLQVDVTSLVATSAALSVVVGLALQETLGNLFAGLSLQLEHPFQVGDWVQVNEFTGRVVQVAWRATKLETLRREQVSIPNGTIAKANVVNFSRHGMVARDVTIGLAYACPPNLVKSVIADVLHSNPDVLPAPPPRVRTLRYDDSAVTYELRFFVKHFDHLEATVDSVLSTLWYRLKREGMEIPFPQRVVEMRQVPAEQPEARMQRERTDTVQLLGSVDFLKPLGPEGWAQLAERVRRHQYGHGEMIIRTGEAGDSFYVVAQGEVAVRAKVGDKEQEVAKLRRGQFFGEMSLLTGEPRSATVAASGDAELISMSREAFGSVLSAHSRVAQDLADILGRRRMELEKAKADESVNMAARAESKRIFSRLRELFKVAED